MKILKQDFYTGALFMSVDVVLQWCFLFYFYIYMKESQIS